ncbi:hypothetical protein M5K25_010983 [Dendrobium thyrsiflorum]|uniref:Secreted protein n=1 Tax=Dendrobium thyrsiflorum TaxID=117978 RepID=A0ABD0V146_DENTH
MNGSLSPSLSLPLYLLFLYTLLAACVSECFWKKECYINLSFCMSRNEAIWNVSYEYWKVFGFIFVGKLHYLSHEFLRCGKLYEKSCGYRVICIRCFNLVRRMLDFLPSFISLFRSGQTDIRFFLTLYSLFQSGQCQTGFQRHQTFPPADLSVSAGGEELVQELGQVLVQVELPPLLPLPLPALDEASAVEDVEGIVGEECRTVGWRG